MKKWLFLAGVMVIGFLGHKGIRDWLPCLLPTILQSGVARRPHLDIVICNRDLVVEYPGAGFDHLIEVRFFVKDLLHSRFPGVMIFE